MEGISYFFTEPSTELDLPAELQAWLLGKAHSASFSSIIISYIFCTDEELLEMNQRYLDHDYYTDILTFDLSERNDRLEAECYISLERVEDNAKKRKKSTRSELYRVMAHGLLHLLGHDDNTRENKKAMRAMEDAMLLELRSTWNVAF